MGCLVISTVDTPQTDTDTQQLMCQNHSLVNVVWRSTLGAGRSAAAAGPVMPEALVSVAADRVGDDCPYLDPDVPNCNAGWNVCTIKRHNGIIGWY